jgi:hypothetical protein
MGVAGCRLRSGVVRWDSGICWSPFGSGRVNA